MRIAKIELENTSSAPVSIEIRQGKSVTKTAIAPGDRLDVAALLQISAARAARVIDSDPVICQHIATARLARHVLFDV